MGMFGLRASAAKAEPSLMKILACLAQSACSCWLFKSKLPLLSLLEQLPILVLLCFCFGAFKLSWTPEIFKEDSSAWNGISPSAPLFLVYPNPGESSVGVLIAGRSSDSCIIYIAPGFASSAFLGRFCNMLTLIVDLPRLLSEVMTVGCCLFSFAHLVRVLSSWQNVE